MFTIGAQAMDVEEDASSCVRKRVQPVPARIVPVPTACGPEPAEAGRRAASPSALASEDQRSELASGGAPISDAADAAPFTEEEKAAYVALISSSLPYGDHEFLDKDDLAKLGELIHPIIAPDLEVGHLGSEVAFQNFIKALALFPDGMREPVLRAVTPFIMNINMPYGVREELKIFMKYEHLSKIFEAVLPFRDQEILLPLLDVTAHLQFKKPYPGPFFEENADREQQFKAQAYLETLKVVTHSYNNYLRHQSSDERARILSRFFDVLKTLPLKVANIHTTDFPFPLLNSGEFSRFFYQLFDFFDSADKEKMKALNPKMKAYYKKHATMKGFWAPQA